MAITREKAEQELLTTTGKIRRDDEESQAMIATLRIPVATTIPTPSTRIEREEDSIGPLSFGAPPSKFLDSIPHLTNATKNLLRYSLAPNTRRGYNTAIHSGKFSALHEEIPHGQLPVIASLNRSIPEHLNP